MTSDLPVSNQMQKDEAMAGAIATREKPRRPLSSYNLFFQAFRKKILEQRKTRVEGKPRRSHGKIGFAELARTVSAKWKSIDPETRSYFDELAARDKERYKKEMDEWKKEQDHQANLKRQVVIPTEGSMTMMTSNSAGPASDVLACSPFSIHELAKVPATTLPPFGKQASVPVFPAEGMAVGSFPNQGKPMSTSTMMQNPTFQKGDSVVSFHHSMGGPSIAELASKLDDESVDFFCNLFR